MRIGYGQDIHKLVEGRKLILAGIEIPSLKGLLGHSDADVVMHAFADAILGALALGDIGRHFPDSNMDYKDMDSSIILKRADELMREHRYELGNADVTILLESPKIASYIDKMRANLASILNTDIKNISLKAGTNEGMDAIGLEKACEAIVVVILRRCVK